MQPRGFARFRNKPHALALPVVLGWRWDAVAVVAQADLVSFDEQVECFFHQRKPRVAIHGRVQRCGDVLGRAVDALHILQQANRFRDRLREWMSDLL